MNVFELTRTLVDIESITGNERAVGERIVAYLQPLCDQYGGRLEVWPVEPDRNNVFACWGDPVVTFSTHMDTVPPFFGSSEDAEFIWGRASCDTKGILSSMIKAIEALLASGIRNIGLLVVVGEERNSVGAYHASKVNRGSRFLINGEPTENLLAIGSKGAFRVELQATGKMAHSAYPELGDSAIDKLLDVLADLRRMELPVDEVLGASTLNIGVIAGGRAPNVVADHARAELLIRLIDGGESTRQAVKRAVSDRVTATELLCIPALHMRKLAGLETTVVAYTTDIPAFGGAWGEPFLIGPGTIHVAHTSEERVPKQQLLEAIELYQKMARQLLAG